MRGSDGRYDTRSFETSVLDRTELGEWRLMGRHCGACEETLFGRNDPACQRCGSAELVDITLNTTGVLWSFTVIRNPPPGDRHGTVPELPFGFGLVELDGDGVRVAAPIAVAVDQLSIGLPLTLQVFELYRDDEDQQVMAFHFAGQVAG